MQSLDRISREEKRNIPVEDEILHCVQNDKGGALGAHIPTIPFMR
jgi:hypothetical protein